ncbi:TPA: glycosyltransferase [Staphylococcus aureus]|nr:glycosyltransferase [Staphylococcus aureus]HCU6948564.1 glycosyltransferase [Staphylococcus aureus]HCU9522254.1 glycosyltransferase [Staphylococcus aureus]HCV0426636.1 glycosyltransferase [Staphylococcus aureus]HCV0555401.1 glycosyltransferase [Staphylococcus aureus]
MTTYMLMYSIPEKAGGITSVMLNRSKLLAEKGYSCALLTLDDKNYDPLRAKLTNSGRLHKEVKIVNLYEELKMLYDVENTEIENKNMQTFEKLNLLNQEGFYIKKDEYEEKKYARYFKDNNYIMYKKWINGQLSHIDYFQNRKRIKRHVFQNKILRKEITFNDKNKMSEVKYLSNDGFCYLSYWYGDNENIVNIFYFDKNSKEVLNFKNNKMFHSYWLDKNLTSNDVLILDGIGTYPKVENMQNNDVKKIFTIHTNHFLSPYSYGAEIKPEFRNMLLNLKELDTLVVLTKEQKDDIIKQFGDYNNIKVIPNAVSFEENLTQNIREKNSIIVLQRFVAMKNITHIISAINIVRKKVKDVKLHIYGTGTQKENYTKLIKKLKLQDNVFIHDYAFDIRGLYTKASLSVLTSDYEGLPMSLLEAMSYGVPVISYPINYGPKSIIQNNINGIITKKKDNINELAKKIIHVLKKETLISQFSENARTTIKTNFSYEAVSKKWIELIDEKSK